ncbi:MAG: hypothetical protein ACK5IQ_10405 [Bacteroidales bacterium]
MRGACDEAISHDKEQIATPTLAKRMIKNSKSIKPIAYSLLQN